MHYTLLFFTVLFYTACGDTAPKASENIQTEHYRSLTDEHNETVIQDIRQQLLFVNSQQGCKALHEDTQTLHKTVTQFCTSLHFYGRDDWRVPTLHEIQTFSEGMDAEGVVPYFTFPKCKRVIGEKEDGSIGTINTHNASPKFEEVPLELPAGLRCVTEAL